MHNFSSDQVTAEAAPIPEPMPRPFYRGLTACMPTGFLSTTSERVRVQGSPGFQCVYVNVDEHLVALPLDIAYQVANAIRDHACQAQLRTMDHLRGRANPPSAAEVERALGPIRSAGL